MISSSILLCSDFLIIQTLFANMKWRYLFIISLTTCLFLIGQDSKLHFKTSSSTLTAESIMNCNLFVFLVNLVLEVRPRVRSFCHRAPPSPPPSTPSACPPSRSCLRWIHSLPPHPPTPPPPTSLSEMPRMTFCWEIPSQTSNRKQS